MKSPVLAASALALALALVACTSETIVRKAAPTEPTDTAETEPTPSPAEPAAAPADAGVDAAPPAPVAAWVDGEAGKSCAAACATAGKTCAVACKDHPSCGGHDDQPGPYAGYACYYFEKKDASGSIRLNEGRSLLACDEVASSTWSPPYSSTKYTLGSYVPALAPVHCCCE